MDIRRDKHVTVTHERPPRVWRRAPSRALRMTHESRERRVHGERDVARRTQLAERGSEVVVHPEATFEIDLARRQLPFAQCIERRRGRVT